MAAKTTTGSGFDRIFRLFGPGFLLESEFIHACIEAVPAGADKCAFCDYVKNSTFLYLAILAPLYLRNETR